MLPPSDHVPEGYVRIKPGGPLFSKKYLAAHPVVENRLRARRDPEPRTDKAARDKAARVEAARDEAAWLWSQMDEAARLRRQLHEADILVSDLHRRMATLEARLRLSVRSRHRISMTEMVRQDDVRDHAEAYVVFVWRCILADLEPDPKVL